MQVPTRKYMADALRFSSEEYKLRAELNDWLPDEIIDCHAHANEANVVLQLSGNALTWVYSSFPDFSIQDSLRVHRMFYGAKRVSSLRFANPYKGIDHRKANTYLINNSPKQDRVALCGLPDDVIYTVQEIQNRQYTAVKMYPNYFEPPAKTIIDFFPCEVLEAAQNFGIPIILHPPKPLAACLDEILGISKNFPKLGIVLAHLGRHYEATSASLAAYQVLAPYNQIVLDTSMVPSANVLKQVFTTLGPERVLFGSDEPMNLLRYVEYHHPDLGRRIMSAYPYHWLDEKHRQQYGYLADGVVHLHWQVLSSIRTAILEKFPTNIGRVKSLVFSENSQRVFPLFRSH